MSYPAKGLEGFYRNPYNQVKKYVLTLLNVLASDKLKTTSRFFDIRHHGHYKVYNL